MKTTETVGPVLIHIITQKGKGYLPAETASDKMHGVGPYNPKDGKSISKPSSKPKVDPSPTPPLMIVQPATANTTAQAIPAQLRTPELCCCASEYVYLFSVTGRLKHGATAEACSLAHSSVLLLASRASLCSDSRD